MLSGRFEPRKIASEIPCPLGNHKPPGPFLSLELLIVPNNASDIVFGDSASGFVRGSRDPNVQYKNFSVSEANKPNEYENDTIDEEILEKLDKEGEEFSRDELLELQNQLAKDAQGKDLYQV